MDEPFGAVDPIVRGNLQQEFLALQKELGKTVVFVTHDIDEAILLGTRIAILNVGGVLEQYDQPATILSEPANQFVEDFLGGERGLKRLGLLPISSAVMVRGPVVERTASAAEAQQAMRDHGVDWLGILDGPRLLGWVDAKDLDGGTPDAVTPKPFAVSLRSDCSLREALDAVVTGHARTAVVVDDGVYQGMLDLEAISKEITE
jgi:osmoprotectant transport system ATP-binding protein